MILMLSGAAWAATIGLGAGLQHALDDPMQQQTGLRVSGVLTPELASWATLQLDGTLFPDPSAGTLTPLANQLIKKAHLSPDLSPVRVEAQWSLAFGPDWHDISLGAAGDVRVRAGAQLGLAALYTVDDLESLGLDPDDADPATTEQIHLAPCYGLHGDLRRGHLGGRLVLERAPYTEQVLDIEERRGNWWLSAELMAWF